MVKSVYKTKGLPLPKMEIRNTTPTVHIWFTALMVFTADLEFHSFHRNMARENQNNNWLECISQQKHLVYYFIQYPHYTFVSEPAYRKPHLVVIWISIIRVFRIPIYFQMIKNIYNFSKNEKNNRRHQHVIYRRFRIFDFN